MIFKKKKTTRIYEVVEENTKVLDIYKNSKGTFSLFCDVKKANGTVGTNQNFAISMLTDNGFVLIADNNMLNISNIATTDSSAINKINTAFETFKEFADTI